MRLLNDKKIAIVGAGPVGLLMARLLQLKGAKTTVYERDLDRDARIWGGTLDLHKTSGQLALQKAGLLEKYYELSIPMGIKFADIQGGIMAVKSMTAEHRRDNPEINRNVLRTMLLDSLMPGSVQWDSHLVSLEAQNSAWRLRFANCAEATADMVILASGGMAKMRSIVTDEVVEETGSFIVQGDVPDPAVNLPEFYKLCDNHRLMVASGGNLLVANPLNGDKLTYGLIFKKPETWQGNLEQDLKIDFSDQAMASTYLKARLGGWSELYHSLIEKTTQFVGLPTRVLPLAQPWKPNRPLPITLIGDAAHLMPPFAGMGVNIGLMDATILTENLVSDRFSNVTDAINDYEKQMMAYAKAASAESRENELEMRDPDFDFRKMLQLA
ncbi:NAD(P)/FAD-dependent oxidoreductase [Arachidicoccus ginsenosidivorans]|uniref:Flavin-dependent monooxygenase n=1 Tax=Arachidicoccus ginsenosidivorans TaxID=496057 RepID=A0A5B8VQ38_9BACT|nr:NAD(P)/FAD-dependent oxidoreductase [Arachidicoccus ginsenosidivorans]QEC72806.1 FAD-dependent monooxygenase [Arachidicoccus ginsenosidivorans]